MYFTWIKWRKLRFFWENAISGGAGTLYRSGSGVLVGGLKHLDLIGQEEEELAIKPWKKRVWWRGWPFSNQCLSWFRLLSERCNKLSGLHTNLCFLIILEGSGANRVRFLARILFLVRSSSGHSLVHSPRERGRHPISSSFQNNTNSVLRAPL